MSLSNSSKSCRRSGCSICHQATCACPQTVLNRSLNRDLLYLKSKGFFSDFLIQVGECTFPVHRAVLAARSNVFLAMFQQTNTVENLSSILILADSDPSCIDSFLHYLYSDTCMLTDDKRAEQMLELADKYNVESLKGLIEDYFVLTKDNCLRLLILADRHSALRLKDTTLKYINTNLTHIFAETGTADWFTFRQTHTNLVADLYEKAVNLPAVFVGKK